MIHGSCHCGAVGWSFDGIPETAATCNCTLCRRYGVVWAYGHEGERISVRGSTQIYTCHTRRLGFHFCATCGCVAYWRAGEAALDGRRRIAVNLRLAEPDDVGAVPVEHLDGLNDRFDQPPDGCCVADMWF